MTMALEDAASEVDVALTGREKGLAYENAFSGATSFLRRRYAKDLAGVDSRHQRNTPSIRR